MGRCDVCALIGAAVTLSPATTANTAALLTTLLTADCSIRLSSFEGLARRRAAPDPEALETV